MKKDVRSSLLPLSRQHARLTHMLWRFLTAIIVLFWAVMTGLIIRDTYFPDHSRFAQVPVSLVFDLFLAEAAAFNNTLQLYHRDEKIGHTSFTIRKISQDEEEPVYGLLASGTVRVPTDAGVMNVSVSLTGELIQAERWKSFKLEVHAPTAETQAEINWKLGDKLPAVEVRKGGQVVMNTQMAEAMLQLPGTLGGKADWLSQILPAGGGLPATSSMQFKAREGLLDLAGKRRRCYVVSLEFMKGYEMKMYFTEIGELARIELPQDYRLLEPMMHGLEPGMNTIE